MSNSIFDENASEHLKLYPNPSSGVIIVKGSAKNCTFELYGIIGKKLFSSKLSENETLIDLNAFNNGTYLFKILEHGKVVKQDKLIISK